jgi:hypothetical protein
MRQPLGAQAAADDASDVESLTPTEATSVTFLRWLSWPQLGQGMGFSLALRPPRTSFSKGCPQLGQTYS